MQEMRLNVMAKAFKEQRTDPDAAKEYQAILEKEAQLRKQRKEQQEERIKTDPAYAVIRAYHSRATVKSYQKMKADAEAGDPEAIRRHEATLAKRRESYYKKRNRMNHWQ